MQNPLEPMSQQAETSALESDRTAPIGPVLLLCLVLATLLNLGNVHKQIDADVICPVMNSLYAWTPFYWEGIRFGQLLPLLALPFKNPLTNLLVQTELSFFASFSAIFLITRYLQKGPHWPLTGAGLWLLAELSLPQGRMRFFMSPGQCYGPSLALAAGALIVLEDLPRWGQAWRRLLLATLLLTLSHWMNSAIAVLLIPLLILRFVCGRQISLRECVAGVLLSGGTFVAMFAASQLVRITEFQHEDPIFPFTLSPLREWPDKWLGVLLSLQGVYQYSLLVFGAATIIPAVAAAATREGRLAMAGALKRLTPPLLAGVGFGLLITTLKWVPNRDAWACRYITPAVFIIVPAICVVCWNAWWPAIVRRRSLMTLASGTAMMLIVATLGVSGLPSLTNVRRDIDKKCGRFTAELRAAGCTHLAGDYWEVWPAMFHANLVAYERGESTRMWSMAYRSTELQRRWREVPVQNLKLAFMKDGVLPELWPLAFNVEDLKRQSSEKFDIAAPADLFFVWARGFYGEEHSEGSTFRWARKNAELWVCNRTTIPQQVQLDLQFLRDEGPAARLRISSDWFQDEIQVSGKQTALTRTFSLPPGWHTVKLACDGTRIAPQDASRWLVFRVLNARMTPAPAIVPQSAPAPSGDSRRDDLAGRDANAARK